MNKKYEVRILKDKSLKWPEKLINYGAKILPMKHLEIILDVIPVSEVSFNEK